MLPKGAASRAGETAQWEETRAGPRGAIMTRRDLIKSPLILSAAAAPPDAWFDRPMRWVQLAFVEDDPGNYDLSFWLDYFRRVHADAACLSAGGCVAFYPTRIPLHYKSRFMKEGTDPFDDLLKGCRDLGMNVIARVDPHAALLLGHLCARPLQLRIYARRCR